MESINVAEVLLEAGDTDSRAHTRFQVYAEYFVNLLSLPFIRLSHWGMREVRVGRVNSYQGVVGETGGGYYVIDFLNCAFVFCSLMSCLFF